MAGWLPLFPKQFWELPGVRRVARLLDSVFEPGRLRKHTSVRPIRVRFKLAKRFRSVNRIGYVLVQLFCFVCAAFFLWWNINNINPKAGWMPRPLMFLGYRSAVDQHFQMFGTPPLQSPWFIYDAYLADKSHRDVFRDQPVDYERPESVYRSINNHHWRKMHRNLTHPELVQFRKPLAEYALRQWNKTHQGDSRALYLRLTCKLDLIGPGVASGDEVTSIWD